MDAFERERLFRGELAPTEPACMPRRYGIGTLLVISTAYACLIAFLQLLGAPWPVVVGFCVLFTVIGLFQMFSRPAAARQASSLAGVLVMTVFGILVGLAMEPRKPAGWFCAAGWFALSGILVGYEAGALVGGVILIMRAVERWIGSKPLDALPKSGQPQPQNPWTDPSDPPESVLNWLSDATV
jgi:hypothetical protein